MPALRYLKLSGSKVGTNTRRFKDTSPYDKKEAVEICLTCPKTTCKKGQCSRLKNAMKELRP